MYLCQNVLKNAPNCIISKKLLLAYQKRAMFDYGFTSSLKSNVWKQLDLRKQCDYDY